MGASLASGAALILGAKLLALKGVLIGRALRGKRETLEEIFLEASKKDQYDCAKMLVCELNAKSILEEDERIIAQTFGRMVGSQRCKTMYSRCTDNTDEIMAGIRKIALK